jgi:hypothetical protein
MDREDEPAALYIVALAADIPDDKILEGADMVRL